MTIVLVAWFLAYLILSYCPTSHAQQASSSYAEQLQQCYNSEDTERRWVPGHFDDFMQGQAARLHLYQVHWSKKQAPTAGKAPGLTIVTGATVSRLDSLVAQCRQWNGILAAAVYLPLHHTRAQGQQLDAQAQAELQKASMTCRQLFARMEAEPTSCVLRLLLVYELVGDDMLGRLLPINSLRNTAMLAADTELMAMVDVDLLPSQQLSELVTKDTEGLTEIKQLCDKHKLVVMPAFETAKNISLVEGQQLAHDLAVGGDKDKVFQAVQQAKVLTFAQEAYQRGHNATNFARWYTTKKGYDIQYQINYEPWFIILRSAALLYDARFRGYGWNKATQVAHLSISGFGFHVHPSLYLVHRPHPKSDAQGVYNKAAAQKSDDGKPSYAKQFHRKVGALRHVSIRDMRRGTFVGSPGKGVAACMNSLPWWKGLHPELLVLAQAGQTQSTG